MRSHTPKREREREREKWVPLAGFHIWASYARVLFWICGREKKCWKNDKVEAKQNKTNNRNHIQFDAYANSILRHSKTTKTTTATTNAKSMANSEAHWFCTQISGHAAEFLILSPGKNHNDVAYVIRFFYTLKCESKGESLQKESTCTLRYFMCITVRTGNHATKVAHCKRFLYVN